MSLTGSGQIIHDPFFIATTSISVAGSILLFSRTLTVRNSIETPMKLILLISLSDFLYCLLSLVQLSSLNDLACQIVGFCRVFVMWMASFFSSSVSLMCYLIMIGVAKSKISKIIYLVVLASILISLSIALV